MQYALSVYDIDSTMASMQIIMIIEQSFVFFFF